MKNALSLSALVLSLATSAAGAAPASPSEAIKIGTNAGCMTCHHIEPGAKGPDGLAPIGPAWRDVSAKYQGQKDAQKNLTHIVLTGSNPYESHWKGKVSGLAMPPNKVAITEADANKVVAWILSLEAKKQK